MAVTIDGTTGITTPGLTNTGALSLVDLTITGNTIIGNATTDTLVVGVNGIVKDTFGNVGIGTSSPSNTLHVVGSQLLTSASAETKFNITNTGTGGIQYWIGSTNNSSGAVGGGRLAFYDQTSNAARMVIDSSGNVGIGTTSPAAKLQAAGSGSDTRIFATKTDVSVTAQMGAETSTAYAGSYTNHPYVFRTNDTERMRIDASGNVGIGTQSPGVKLDVVGTMRANTSVVAGNSSFGITINQNSLTSVGANSNFVITKPVPTISNSSRFDFNTGSLNTGILAGPWWNGVHFSSQDVITNASAANEFPRTSHYYSYSTVTNPTDLNYNIVTGNSTVPQHMTIGTATSANIKFLIANAEAMRIDYNNNVGIGTSSPASGVRLDVQDNAPIVRVTSTTGTNAVRYQLINTGGTSQFGRESSGGGTILSGADGYSTVLTGAGAYPMIFGTNSTERMRIDSSGNVGIGIGALSFSTQVTPSLTMYGGNTGLCLRNATTGTGNNVGTDIFLGTGGDLNIDQRSAQPIYFQTTATTRMAITASGDVGINTTTPSKKFEVYTSANSLQIGAIVRNDQAGTGVAAIGFNVSSPATSDASVTKAGIGLVRNATFGRGVLTFYNDNSAANNDFTTANAVMSIDSSGVLGFNSGYGSVGNAYGCRAWIAWTDNGTATTTRGSGNVTSITRNATSDYTINFTTAMPDVNYSVAGTSGFNTTSMAALVVPINLTAPTTSAVRVQSVSSDGVLRAISAGVAFYSVAIFR